MVLHDVAKHPYSIAIFETRLYWSDWSTNSIRSCDKLTGKDYRTLFQTRMADTIYGIHIYHPTLKVQVYLALTFPLAFDCAPFVSSKLMLSVR